MRKTSISAEELGTAIVSFGGEAVAGADHWRLEISEELVITISHSTEDAKLILAAVLGEPDPIATEPVLGLMAGFNGLADMTGPMAVSLDPETDILSLSAWIPLAGLEASAIETITADFAMRAMMLSRAAADGDPDDEIIEPDAAAIHATSHEEEVVVRV